MISLARRVGRKFGHMAAGTKNELEKFHKGQFSEVRVFTGACLLGKKRDLFMLSRKFGYACAVVFVGLRDSGFSCSVLILILFFSLRFSENN